MRFMQRTRASGEDLVEDEAPATTRRSFGGYGAKVASAPATEIDEAGVPLRVPTRAKPGFQTVLRVGLDGGHGKFQPPPIPDYGELEIDSAIFEAPKPTLPLSTVTQPKAKAATATRPKARTPTPAAPSAEGTKKRTQSGRVLSNLRTEHSAVRGGWLQ